MSHPIRYKLLAGLVLVSLLVSACGALGVQKTLMPDNSSVVAAAESELTNGNAELAALLALEALENYVYTPQAENALALAVQKMSPNAVHLGTVPSDAQWSPDGKWIVAGDGQNGGKVGIWSWPSAEMVRTIDDLPADAYYLAWSPDGSKLAITTLENALSVWDTTTWQKIWEPKPEKWLYVQGWSPDSQRLAAASARLVQVLNSETGETLTRVASDIDGYMHLRNQSWSPQGDRFVAGTFAMSSDTTPAFVWDATSGKLLLELPSQEGNTIMGAYSPDGKYIATITSPGVIQVWDAVSGEPTSVRIDQAKGMIDLHWSPNSKRIAGGNEKGVVVFDALTGGLVATYDLGGGSTAIDWASAGKNLIANPNGLPQVIPAWQATEDLVAYAKECCAKRELTKEERAKFSLP